MGAAIGINHPYSNNIPPLSRNTFPREASTLIFKIRSCTVRSDLKSKHKISRKCLIYKIRSCSATSDLKFKSARFSGFWDSIAEGGYRTHLPHFHRVSRQYRWDTPFGGGGIAPPLRMLSEGEMLRKGGGGIAPNWPCWDTKNPIARRLGGYRWDSLAVTRAIRGH